MKEYNRIRILGVIIDNLCATSALQRIVTFSPSHSLRITTPNPQMLLDAQKDSSFKKILNSSDLSLPDGFGIILASRFLGTPLKGRISGIDFAEKLLELAEKNGLRVFLLGGKIDVAKNAATNLRKRFPSLNICGTHHGYFKSSYNETLVKIIHDRKTQILLVGLGSPKQEKWMAEYAKKIPTLQVCMGIGGSFDIWGGYLKRAPIWMQKCGCEWLFRCIQQPKRFRVLLQFPVFFKKLLIEKHSGKKRSRYFSSELLDC